VINEVWDRNQLNPTIHILKYHREKFTDTNIGNFPIIPTYALKKKPQPQVDNIDILLVVEFNYNL